MPTFIGSDPINRASAVTGNRTLIIKENPAVIAGNIKKVNAWANSKVTSPEVATFFETAPNTFSTRGWQVIPEFPIGYSSHDVTIPCEIGDYLGYWQPNGRMDYAASGDGWWYKLADAVPCVDTLFTFSATRTVSLQGEIVIAVPPSLNWAVLDLHYCNTPFQVKVTALTDVDCHLWLRWSTVPPRRHPMPVLRRGIKISDDIRFCFTVFSDIEQEEDGDTVLHTFYLPVWPVCTWFYFYLYGQRQTFTSPSTTAIFKAHRDNPFTWCIYEDWTS